MPDGYSVLAGGVDGRRAVGVVVSRFNGEITNRLLERALDELEEVGVPRDAVMVMPVPGAFELPLAAMALAKTRRYACIVALGCVIRGETPHFDSIAQRGGERPPAGGDRDRACRSRSACSRSTTASRPRSGSTAPPTPCGPRSRWPTSSPSSARRLPGPLH